MNIEGKVFVITGAARGLGLAISHAIADKRWLVCFGGCGPLKS